jgi:hypothetical protein
LQNAVVQNLPSASEPTGVKGRIYFDSTNNKLKYYNGTSWIALSASTGGTVTSVGISFDTAAGNIFGVSNSPITSSGEIQITMDSQSANTVLAGPTTGSAAAPTFRSLVADDIPSLDSSFISDFTEAVQDITGGQVTAGTGISATYDDNAGTVTVTNTDLGSSQNIYKHFTDGTNTSNADSNDDTFKLRGSNGVTVTVGEDDATHGDNALISLSSVPNSALANSSVTVTAGTGLSGGGSVSLGGSVTLSNAGVTSITGTSNEVEVSASTGSITIGLPNDVTIGNDLTVTGNLTVNGTTTTLNTETLAVEDNIVLLNKNVTGSPSADAGLEVERGTSTNAVLQWSEADDVWKAGISGSELPISLEGHTHSSSDITDFATAVDTEIDAHLSGSNSISYSSGAIDTTLATTSYLSKSSGLAVDISSLETKLSTDGYTKKYSANIGDGSATSIAVTHSLGTRDVTVQVYDNATYDTVEVDVVRNSTSQVTLGFATAPSSNAYRVVVIG